MGHLKRVTIMIDTKIQAKLREIQAKKIKQDHKGVSFSKVINSELGRMYNIKIK